MSKKQNGKTTEQTKEMKTVKPNAVQDAKPARAAKPAKEEQSVSNLEIASQLLALKADQKAIIATFTEVYRRKGVTDAAFIAKRAAIYLRLAAKAAK